MRDSLTPHRMPMLHSRKADLILISYERELAGKLQSDGQLIREISNLECWTRRPSTIAAAVWTDCWVLIIVIIIMTLTVPVHAAPCMSADKAWTGRAAGWKPVEAISQQVLGVVVLLGADASDTAKSGRYNLPEATLELDQDWTAIADALRTSLMTCDAVSGQLGGVNRRSDDCDCTSDIRKCRRWRSVSSTSSPYNS